MSASGPSGPLVLLCHNAPATIAFGVIGCIFIFLHSYVYRNSAQIRIKVRLYLGLVARKTPLLYMYESYKALRHRPASAFTQSGLCLCYSLSVTDNKLISILQNLNI